MAKGEIKTTRDSRSDKDGHTVRETSPDSRDTGTK
jgi:hypothetical protein